MKASNIIWTIVVLIIILIGLFWWASGTPSTTQTTTQTSTETSSVQPTIVPVLSLMTSTTTGNYLVASNGMTLYEYAKDANGVSNCVATCTSIWPPLIVGPSDSISATSSGVTGVISTINRADGTMQVTYNGKPLYFYSKDNASGDILGKNIGGVWSVAKP